MSFWRYPEVQTARSSLTYWRKRIAEDSCDYTIAKLKEWEDKLNTLRAEFVPTKKLKSKPPKKFRSPRIRQLPPPDAPPLERWVPTPLVWT
jgi:hypothetical protein